MTATGRSSKLSPSADNYPTPGWCVRRFLEAWPSLAHVGTRWLEPCAGDGSIIRAVDEFREARGMTPLEWTAVEYRPTGDDLRAAVHYGGRGGNVFVRADFVGKRIVRIVRPGEGDKVKITSKVIATPNERFVFPDSITRPAPSKTAKPFDVAITNPPFLLTMAFLTRCLELADVVVMLQRQNFIGGKKRNRWMRAHHPDFYMLPDRISFSGDGSTDAIGHGWYTWEDLDAEGAGIFRLLEHTPTAERKADFPRIGLRRPIPTDRTRVRVRRKKKAA